MKPQLRYLIYVIVLLSSTIILIPACKKSTSGFSYNGNYRIHFSAMRSYENRSNADISLQSSGTVDVYLKKDDTGTHIVTFAGCRIFLSQDKDSSHARILPGAHTNTCLLNVGKGIGEVAVAFYNGVTEYNRGGSMKMTLYGTTQPVEYGGPEGTVIFTFTGAVHPGDAQQLHR